MADVYVNALTTIGTEPTTTDSMVAVNRNTNEGKIIDYNLLADAILNKLTSKQYSGLSTTSKLLVGAINELDSDVSSLNSSLATLGRAPVRILDQTNLTTTATSYSCDWASYRMLLICTMQYNNVTSTMLLPYEYFNVTNSSTRARITDPMFNFNYELYKDGTDTVYIKASADTGSIYSIRIFGIK